MQTKQQIQALLEAADARPRHRWGQNFMIDGNLLRLLAKAGNLQPGDRVIEIGPGTGSLTEELLAARCRVVAVEIDGELVKLLQERLGANPNFELIHADALTGKHAINPALLREIAGGPSKLVANLPYQIACPLVIELLIAGTELLAFTVQKEVAQRLAAGPGGEYYGPLSVMAQLLARVEILRTLPPQAFWPSPKVDSALVRMTRQDQLRRRAVDFGRFVHAVFSYRRKMLRKAMLEAGVAQSAADDALGASGLTARIRPEEVSPAQWLDLFGRINPASNSNAASAM